jgi:GTP-dependent dephospho-CoA kinase
MYKLPESLRPALAAPFGPVHDTAGALRAVRGRTLIAVGDVVTQTFLDAGLVPKLMIVDGHTQRGSVVHAALERLPKDVSQVVVENPAATVTERLYRAVEDALTRDGATLIIVKGEEDLAALPAMIFAPEGALVCYGQPHRGVVVVETTPEVRARANDILHQMQE